MSTISRAPAPPSARGAVTPSAIRGLASLKRRWVAYVTWRIERATVTQLRSMSDRELKDIGLTRSGIRSALREAAGDRAPSRRDRAAGGVS